MLNTIKATFSIVNSLSASPEDKTEEIVIEEDKILSDHNIPLGLSAGSISDRDKPVQKYDLTKEAPPPKNRGLSYKLLLRNNEQ